MNPCCAASCRFGNAQKTPSNSTTRGTTWHTRLRQIFSKRRRNNPHAAVNDHPSQAHVSKHSARSTSTSSLESVNTSPDCCSEFESLDFFRKPAPPKVPNQCCSCGHKSSAGSTVSSQLSLVDPPPPTQAAACSFSSLSKCTSLEEEEHSPLQSSSQSSSGGSAHRRACRNCTKQYRNSLSPLKDFCGLDCRSAFRLRYYASSKTSANPLSDEYTMS